MHELRLDGVLDAHPAGIDGEHAHAQEPGDGREPGVVVNETPDLLELATARLGHPVAAYPRPTVKAT